MSYPHCALTCAIDEDPSYDPRYDYDYDYYDYYSDADDQPEPDEVKLEAICNA